MAEEYQEKNTPEESSGKEKESPRREHVFLRRLGVLLVTILVVLGAVTVALLSKGNYLDRVRRWLAYGSGAEENLYAFAADDNNRYGQIGEYLVVVNQNYVQFLTDDGEAYLAQQVQLSTPAMDIGGDLAVAYDVGGQNLYVFSKDGEQMHLELDEGYGFICAGLNDQGYLAVVAQESGYKGAVTVYNPQQEKIFAYRSSSQFLIDAAVSADSRSVLIAALGEEGNAFCTDLLYYHLDETESAGTTTLSDHLTMTLQNLGDSYASVSDKDISFLDKNGACTGSFAYESLYLLDYALEGQDFSALLLNRYRSGSVGTLVTVGRDGQVAGARDITEEVLDISAAGSYVAVLYSDTLVVYNRQLEEVSRLEGTGYASHVLMSSDGSALVIAGNTAWRYVP